MDFQLRRTRLCWGFPLGRSYSAELTNMKVSKGDGLWEVSEKRRININQFMFKGVINDKLKLAWTEQVPSFPQQMNFNVFCTTTVWNYTEPNLHRKEACFVLHRMTMNGNIQGTALYQLICGWLVNALLFQVRKEWIYMTDMPENITLCELRSTQTFYIRPEIHNSSKCYLTLAELAWKKRKSRPALMWVLMRTIHLVHSRPLQMIYGMHDISRVYTVD